jgi:hypothetical protein
VHLTPTIPRLIGLLPFNCVIPLCVNVYFALVTRQQLIPRVFPVALLTLNGVLGVAAFIVSEENQLP